MDIIVNQNKINIAAKIAERAVSKNISLPILSTVLLKAEKGTLRLAATNLELGLNYWIGAKIDKEGEVAVPAKLLSSFLSNINDEKIKLFADNNTLKILSDSYKTKVLGFDTKDFPIIPKVKKEYVVSIDAKDLKRGLLSVVEAATLSEARPELTGVFVNIIGNKIEFVATDSFRLAEFIVGFNNKNGVEKQFIIPRNTVTEVIRITDNIEKEVNVAISDNQILFFNDDFELISRLIDGRYPEYKKIIPDKIVSTARLNKNDLEKSIRTASIFSSSIYEVRMKVGDKKTEINTQNNDRGEFTTNIPSELKNRQFETLLNYNYLLEGLKNITTDNVIMYYTGDGGPLLLRPEAKTDYLYLIMPL